MTTTVLDRETYLPDTDEEVARVYDVLTAHEDAGRGGLQPRCPGLSRPTVVELLDGEEIPFRRVGTHRRILLHHLSAFCEERRTEQYAGLDATGSDADEDHDVDAVLSELRGARTEAPGRRRLLTASSSAVPGTTGRDSNGLADRSRRRAVDIPRGLTCSQDRSTRRCCGPGPGGTSCSSRRSRGCTGRCGARRSWTSCSTTRPRRSWIARWQRPRRRGELVD